MVEEKTIEEDFQQVSGDLAKANKKIKGAWIAGIFSGSITLFSTLVEVLNGGIGILGLNSTRWNILDALLLYGLSFGIYKKNRLCAIALFTYFVFPKTWMYVESGNYRVFIIAIVFAVFLFRGIIGTFAYRRLIEKKKRIYASLRNLPRDALRKDRC